MSDTSDDPDLRPVRCPACDGTGHVLVATDKLAAGEPCPICRGTGWLQAEGERAGEG